MTSLRGPAGKRIRLHGEPHHVVVIIRSFIRIQDSQFRTGSLGSTHPRQAPPHLYSHLEPTSVWFHPVLRPLDLPKSDVGLCLPSREGSVPEVPEHMNVVWPGARASLPPLSPCLCCPAW